MRDPITSTAHPVAAAAGRWGCFDAVVPGHLVTKPGQPGWHPLAAATDPAWVQALVDRVEAGGPHGRRPRAVAGAYVGSGLTWAVVQPLAAVFAAEGRGLDVALPNAAVLVDEDGWATRLALVEPRFAARPDDPAAAHPDATVLGDDATLTAWTADRVADAYTTIFAALRATSPYGLRGLWGALADTVASIGWLLHDHGATPAELDAAWARTEALVDALQDRVPDLRARSRRFALRAPHHEVRLAMRSTCCLYYRTPEADAEVAGGEGDGLCTTCPRRTDADRVARVEANLAAEAEAGSEA